MIIGASGGGGGGGFFLLILIAFAFLWFVLIRPQKRRQLDQQRMLDQLNVGDEVVTAGGIYGEITELVDDEDVMVRIAPDIVVRIARRAIGGVVHPEEPDEPEDEPVPSETDESPVKPTAD